MKKNDNTGNTWDRQIDKDGAFNRKPTSFHHSISVNGPFEPEKNRYHLYVSYACPWAHRTLIVRQLKGLNDVISVDVVASFLPATGWSFNSGEPGATGDRVNHFDDLREVYHAADTDYSGTITVPVLWDKKQKTIVNNESSEIIRLFNRSLTNLPKTRSLTFIRMIWRNKLMSSMRGFTATSTTGFTAAGLPKPSAFTKGRLPGCLPLLIKRQRFWTTTAI